MISAIAVDDELISRESLEFLVSKIDDIQLVASFPSAGELKTFLNGNKVDVIFLDIEMPGLSGLDFLAVTEDLPSIILTTSNPNYALEAFEYDVVDYLVKPISLKRFNQSLDRIRKLQSESEEDPDEIYVRADGKFVKVILDELRYVETLDDYVVMHMEGNRKHIVHSTLSKMDDRLPNSNFQKVHRSYIVNLSKITSVEEAKLNIGDRIVPISRAYRPIIKSRLKLG